MYSQIIYEGDLRCRAINMDTGAQVLTDAPANYEGSKAREYGPTELVAVALGTCMLTVMAVAAQKNKISINGTTCEVHKEMATEGDRRISKIDVLFMMASGVSKDKRGIIEHAAGICPVGKSLHPDIKINIKFNFPD